MTIEIGTLCEIVAHWTDCAESVRHLRGRFCTVTGHTFRDGYLLINILKIPGEPGRYSAPDRCLRPIVPPGDPDRVPHVEREPAELIG